MLIFLKSTFKMMNRIFLNISKMKTFLLILIVFQSISSFSQEERKFIREGNSNYKSSNYSESEISYRKALEKTPQSYKAGFNLGDALYKQKKYEEAANQFQSLTNLDISKEDKAKVYHNLGNSLLQSKDEKGQPKIKESIEAYKQSLRNNPTDVDTKYNLAYATKMLQQQMQQQQNDKNDKDDKNKDNKDQQNKDNQDQNKDKDKENKDKQDQQQNENQDKNQEKQQEQKAEKKDQISKEDAERLLKSIENDEKKLQEDLKKAAVKTQKVKIEKDW